MTHLVLEASREMLGLSVIDLWWRFFALGGSIDAYDLSGYLAGRTEATDNVHDTIVHALNETFNERGHDAPVPYRDDTV